MRVRSNVNPTPIVSVSAVPSSAAETQPKAAAVPPAPLVETEPLTVDLGNKIIELQPGELVKVVDKLNQTARVFNQTLQFQMSDSKQIVIRVIDTASGQVVREIPPEKAVDAVNQMQDVLGLLLDMKA